MIDLKPVRFVFFNNNTCGTGLKKALTFIALATFNCTVVNLNIFYELILSYILLLLIEIYLKWLNGLV